MLSANVYSILCRCFIHEELVVFNRLEYNFSYNILKKCFFDVLKIEC